VQCSVVKSPGEILVPGRLNKKWEQEFMGIRSDGFFVEIRYQETTREDGES
jgi:hypothetical protein